MHSIEQACNARGSAADDRMKRVLPLEAQLTELMSRDNDRGDLSKLYREWQNRFQFPEEDWDFHDTTEGRRRRDYHKINKMSRVQRPPWSPVAKVQ